MYGIFGQSKDGMVWLANMDTLEQAHAEMAEHDTEGWDFMMILPVAAFWDVDGDRE